MAPRRYITFMPIMVVVCSFHGLQDSNCHHGARARMGSELLDRSVLYRSAADRKLAADNSAVERPVADSQLHLLLSHCSTGRLLR